MKQVAIAFQIKSPPVYAVLTWVKPEDETKYLAPCVERAGFEYSKYSGYSVPADQKSAFNRAMYQCHAEYPAIPKYTQALTKKNLATVYDWTVRTEIPCLARHGYRVTGVPTEAVFIANYYTKPFYPYAQLPNLSNEQTVDLNDECPQWPPSQVLYGG